MSAYLNNPQPSTILVLAHKNKSMNKNSGLYKLLDKKAVVVESKKIYESQVYDWVKDYGKKHGFPIEDQAIQLLIEALGANLSKLHNELSKLMLIVPAGGTIQAATVEIYVGISKEYNVFELQRALALRQAVKVERIIRYMAADPKKHPLIPMLSLLYNFFSKVLIAYAQTDRSDNHLAKVLKVGYYFVQDMA